jgi:C4-dicarboxylate-specific signal transduction histidine kinase
MILELIIAFVVVRYLRQSLQTAIQLPKWDRILIGIRSATVGLLVVGVAVPFMKGVAPWLSHGLLLYLVYILYSEKDFSPARPIMLAIAPFIILSIFSEVTKLTNEDQFKAWKSFLNLLNGASFVWMIAMYVITTRQKKALDKEKIKTKEEEEQRKVMTSLKAELEVQVAQRTAELTRQKEELEQTLEELKATQTQLIQSEKMASLGELTAGIAHEIQNPLNFVNNFSEVNTELIAEMKTEIDKGNIEEVKAIANDIADNEQKINHHGKRADAIVKGMLQHSRTSTSVKEPASINALADEYLRLAYHGLRAKDKVFNSTMKTAYDESIPNINIIPQDIGRVFLNLYTNAFYAVTEKKKQMADGYEPTVSVITRKTGQKVLICVKDNGNGIPQKSLDKIFQPFFTTKPTGQGTGLGLSLSYDIVKAHGGEIKVDTKEGEGSEFIIQLPAV